MNLVIQLEAAVDSVPSVDFDALQEAVLEEVDSQWDGVEAILPGARMKVSLAYPKCELLVIEHSLGEP